MHAECGLILIKVTFTYKFDEKNCMCEVWIYLCMKTCWKLLIASTLINS